MMQLSQVTKAVDGKMVGADVALMGVTTDSRGQCDDELFIALRGERFDAHDFVTQAENSGARALMVEREVESVLPKVVVADCHQALKDLAAWWRAQFVIPVIGVTGSVGKTTVKEMLACIFAEVGQGVVTHGNLNNEIGMPLTLMRLTKNDRYAILEMGMNHAGEIKRLTHVAKPTIALINNAAAAHLEGLGSIEAVAHAKGEIFSGLTEDGVAVINEDDDYADLWRKLIGSKNCISFGFSERADIQADYNATTTGLKVSVRKKGNNFKFNLCSQGKHSVSNALAAIAVAGAANIPAKLIKSGLQKYSPIAGRLKTKIINSVSLFDDTYNANPASMHAAIEVLADHDKTILIVGDMAELGDATEQAHIEVGAVAAKSGIDILYACGKFANLVVREFGDSAFAFDSQTELIEALTVNSLKAIEGNGSAILVKGSRSAKMENVVAHLQSLLGKLNSDEVTGGQALC